VAHASSWFQSGLCIFDQFYFMEQLLEHLHPFAHKIYLHCLALFYQAMRTTA